jgi:sugar lactone lactonase YvrE
MANRGTVEVMHRGGHFFESPRWRSDRWWVSDMFGDRIIALDPVGRVTDERLLPDHPSGLGWLPDGRMIAVLMRRRLIVDVACPANPTVHAELGWPDDGAANDLVVALSGRAWVGSLGFDMAAREAPRSTQLLTVGPRGDVSIAAGDLMTPNGTVITSDGGTMIVAESLASRLTSFRVEPDGSLGERQVWAQLAPPPPLTDLRSCLRALTLAPDGLAIDSEDSVWVADAAGGPCLLVARGGEILASVPPPPGLLAVACALGGPAGTTLLMCCAPDAIEARRVGSRDSVLVAVEVEVSA